MKLGRMDSEQSVVYVTYGYVNTNGNGVMILCDTHTAGVYIQQYSEYSELAIRVRIVV